MSGLHDAAAALLQEAPEPVVLTVIRLLLDARAPARTPQAPSPSPVSHQPAATAQPAAAAADPAWEALRREIKTAMAGRNASWSDLGAAIARTEIAVRIAVGSRKPPPPIVRRRLQAWLDQAPAVAAAPVPFPGSRSNGSDPARAYGSAA